MREVFVMLEMHFYTDDICSVDVKVRRKTSKGNSFLMPICEEFARYHLLHFFCASVPLQTIFHSELPSFLTACAKFFRFLLQTRLVSKILTETKLIRLQQTKMGKA